VELKKFLTIAQRGIIFKKIFKTTLL